MSGRRSAIGLVIFALACSEPPARLTPYEEGEQVVMAMLACIPHTMGLPSELLSTNGDTMLAVRGAPSTLDLEADEVACVLAAGSDCAAVRGCFDIELFRDDRCRAPSIRCEDDVAVSCIPADASATRPSVRLRQHCAHDERVCDLSSPACRDLSCATAERTCDGDVLVRECEGVTQHVECDPGRHCDASALRCIGTGAPCTRSTCALGVLSLCDISRGQLVGTVDCTVNGQHCGSDLGSPRCVADHDACNQATNAGCFETRVMYCDPSGQFRQYDCVAHGFGPCESSGVPATRCGPAGPRLF